MKRQPDIITMLPSDGAPDLERAAVALLPLIMPNHTEIGTWVVDTFMATVEQIPIAGCWLWTGRQDGNGYGSAVVGNKTFGAHKLSHILFKGQVPAGLVVCHTCDVPLCVNPAHLFLGTHSDNMLDAFRKGRLKPPTERGTPNPVRGEAHHKSKLTIEQVREIRASTKSNSELAREYGVDRTSIRAIKTGKSWKHESQR